MKKVHFQFCPEKFLRTLKNWDNSSLLVCVNLFALKFLLENLKFKLYLFHMNDIGPWAQRHYIMQFQ